MPTVSMQSTDVFSRIFDAVFVRLVATCPGVAGWNTTAALPRSSPGGKKESPALFKALLQVTGCDSNVDAGQT